MRIGISCLSAGEVTLFLSVGEQDARRGLLLASLHSSLSPPLPTLASSHRSRFSAAVIIRQSNRFEFQDRETTEESNFNTLTQ